MADYSGIYLNYDGTTAQCNSKQVLREMAFDNTSGLVRYLTAASGLVYLAKYHHNHSKLVDPDGVTSVTIDASGWTHLANLANAGYETGSFLVNDSGLIKSRTAAEVVTELSCVTGTGTSGYMPVWDSNTSLIDSIIAVDSGTATIYGSGIVEVEHASTSGVIDVLTLRRFTSGTASEDDIGGSILFQTEDHYSSVGTYASIDGGLLNGGDYLRLQTSTPGSNVSSITLSSLSTTIEGNPGNSVVFNYAGSIGLNGTCRINQTIPICIDELANGTTPPTPITSGNMKAYSYDIGDDSSFVIRLPENYYQGATSDEFHINIVYSTNEAYAVASGEVQWKVDWEKYYYGGNTAPGGSASSGSSYGGDVNLPALAGGIQRKTITVSGIFQDDGYFHMNLSRVALNDGNDPSTAPAILQVYVTYEADAFEE